MRISLRFSSLVGFGWETSVTVGDVRDCSFGRLCRAEEIEVRRESREAAASHSTYSYWPSWRAAAFASETGSLPGGKTDRYRRYRRYSRASGSERERGRALGRAGGGEVGHLRRWHLGSA